MKIDRRSVMNKKNISHPLLLLIVIAVALLSSCGVCVGTVDGPYMVVYLLAETPQPAEIEGKRIDINTSRARMYFESYEFYVTQSLPACKRRQFSQYEKRSQFPELTNNGTEPIYSFAHFEHPNEISSALTNLEAQFPDFARLKYAYSRGRYNELLISDEEITDPLSADAQRWTEGAEFAKAVVDELCAGEFVGCKYVTVIEPGETANIVANYFADEDW